MADKMTKKEREKRDEEERQEDIESEMERIKLLYGKIIKHRE